MSHGTNVRPLGAYNFTKKSNERDVEQCTAAGVGGVGWRWWQTAGQTRVDEVRGGVWFQRTRRFSVGYCTL